MNAVLAALVASIAAASIACSSNPNASDAIPECGFRTLLRGYDSAIATSGVRFARDEAEWRKLWSEHSANRIPADEPPSIDFSREMVALVTLGQRSSGGFAIEVSNVCEKDGRLAIEALETKPAAGAIVPMVVTHPYHLVATARYSTKNLALRIR